MLRSEILDSSLEGIAGEPLATIGVGQTSAPLDLAALQDRIIYAVVDLDYPPGTWVSAVQFHRDSEPAYTLSLRVSNATGYHFGARADTTEGTNMTLTLGPAPTDRFYALWLMLSEDGNRLTMGTSRGDLITRTIFPGAGMPGGVLRAPSAHAVTAIGYGAAHDASTRARIIAYLGQRFGIPQISGGGLNTAPHARQRDWALAC